MGLNYSRNLYRRFVVSALSLPTGYRQVEEGVEELFLIVLPV